MSKLDLSPLPQQGDDYSNYEESEFRWDRILIAAGMLVSVICMFYLVFFSTSESDSSAPVAVIGKDAVEDMELVEERAPSMPIKTNLVEKKPIEARTITAPEPVSVANIEDEIALTLTTTEDIAQPVIVEAIISEDPKPEILEKPAEETMSNARQPKPVDNVISDVKPASVLIVNSGITRANLSLSLKENQPGKALDHSVVMSGKGIIKVILFTEMSGIRGRTLFHEWYLNGKRLARVKIPVNVSLQKSFSSKFINQQMLGQWQVKVIDDQGEPYVLADFEVISS